MALTAVSGSLLLDACKSKEKEVKKEIIGEQELTIDRAPEEVAAHKKIIGETFFTPHELATISVLSDIIIPADEVSGSATDAKVPEFIEYIVKDMPQHQIPMRGGLRWVDLQCSKAFEKSFVECTQQQQLQIVDQIAFPAKAKPEMKQGVAFFNLMRNLTASGFYTSKIGVEDIGYKGNKPNQWNGVPDDVLKRHGLAYTDKELKECISF